jgi:predicted transcriptional regulator
MAEAVRVWEYVVTKHAGNVDDAASALGLEKSEIYRVMNSAYVIGGRVYEIKRKTKWRL